MTATQHTPPLVRLLWLIERDITQPVPLAELASETGMSRFHLTRSFGLHFGLPLMAYVRRRRLSEAAKALASGQETVTGAGLAAGYDSAEGFSRAFRARFGVAPSSIKSWADLDPLTLQEPLTMTASSLNPQPRIIAFEGRRIFGVHKRFTLETRGLISGFWAETVAVHGPSLMGRETYGVCAGFGEDGAFDYWIASENAAERMEALDLPACDYAVFDHAGHISSIGDTWDSIFNTWAPSADRKLAAGPEFELYAADFNPETPGGVAVWMPLV